ncbi:MAG TPA: Uma2 family endonuclease [Nitrospiraceae bacterium]|nr:Uma2 family endonuclease [Nitrospiraceae bacterium]
MSPQPRLKLTLEDYLLFPDDGRRHELIDGDHYVTPSPNTRHQRISLKLSVTLHTFASHHRLGEVFAAPFDVILSDIDVVEPDLLFVSAERASIVGEVNIRGAPDLVIEILSEGTRKTDEVVKRRLYERYGVAEYWIVDPLLETIKIYRLTEGGYLRAAELSREGHDSLTSPLFPQLVISLDEMFG